MWQKFLGGHGPPIEPLLWWCTSEQDRFTLVCGCFLEFGLPALGKTFEYSLQCQRAGSYRAIFYIRPRRWRKQQKCTFSREENIVQKY